MLSSSHKGNERASPPDFSSTGKKKHNSFEPDRLLPIYACVCSIVVKLIVRQLLLVMAFLPSPMKNGFFFSLVRPRWMIDWMDVSDQIIR